MHKNKITDMFVFMSGYRKDGGKTIDNYCLNIFVQKYIF